MSTLDLDELKDTLEYKSTMEAFKCCMDDLIRLSKTPTDPQYIAYMNDIDNVEMLHGLFELHHEIMNAPRPAYDPFVEAMRRRALAQVEQEREGRPRVAKSRGSAKARGRRAGTKKKTTVTPPSTPFLYVVSRLNEEHKKHVSGGVSSPRNVDTETNIQTKMKDVLACWSLMTEIRLRMEGFTMEKQQREQYQWALRSEKEMLGEGSSSSSRAH